MTKRLPTILALAVVAICAQACSSSSGTATGTGGAGGAATATGGAGGTTTATGGTSGTDAGHDATADATPDSGVNVAALCPAAPNLRNATTASMTAVDYCTLYLATCGGANMPDGGYTALAACETAYTALQFETTRECRSYHVCNAAAYNTANAALHCGHSIGIGLCGDVAVDAGPTDAPTDTTGQ